MWYKCNTKYHKYLRYNCISGWIHYVLKSHFRNASIPNLLFKMKYICWMLIQYSHFETEYRAVLHKMFAAHYYYYYFHQRHRALSTHKLNGRTSALSVEKQKHFTCKMHSLTQFRFWKWYFFFLFSKNIHRHEALARSLLTTIQYGGTCSKS